jgi:dCMP deaminase
MLKNLFKQPILLEKCIELAKTLPELEQHSNCIHRQVGAILYNPQTKKIIASGTNRTPTEESPCIKTNSCTKHITGKCPIIHAEVNTILSARCSLKGAILVCTYSPCYECSKVITAVGIKEVYYIHKHHKTDWKYLVDNNITLTQLEI